MEDDLQGLESIPPPKSDEFDSESDSKMIQTVVESKLAADRNQTSIANPVQIGETTVSNTLGRSQSCLKKGSILPITTIQTTGNASSFKLNKGNTKTNT